MGLSYKPSIPTANIRLTQMSADNIDNIEKEYIQYSANKKLSTESNEESETLIKILEKLDNIEVKLNRKEETMAELVKDEVLDSVEMEEVETTNVEMAQDEKTEEVVEAECIDSKEESKMEEVETTEEPTEDTEMAEIDDNQEEVEVYQAEKLSELEAKIGEQTKIIAEQLGELEELRSFKSKIEDEQKQAIIMSTISKVADHIDEDALNKFKESAEKCSYAEINGWKNEVLSSVVDKVLMSEQQKEADVMDMGIPTQTEIKTSIYD